jgi:hypothetical protein
MLYNMTEESRLTGGTNRDVLARPAITENASILKDKPIYPRDAVFFQAHFALIETDEMGYLESHPDVYIKQVILKLKEFSDSQNNGYSRPDAVQQSYGLQKTIESQITTLQHGDFRNNPLWKKQLLAITRSHCVSLIDKNLYVLQEAQIPDERYPNGLRNATAVEQMLIIENKIRSITKRYSQKL